MAVTVHTLFRLAVYLLLIAPALACAQGAPSPDELRQRAEAGDREAQFRLGVAYDTGRGVTRDRVEAMKWYLRAAEAGYAEAQNSVGSGLQAEKRYEEARKWYERAAAQGHALATSNLGYLYDLGLGVEQDRHKGFELYSRAADLGWAEAMWNLANMYGAGQLGDKDLDMACVWTFRAVRFADPRDKQRLAPVFRAAGSFEQSFPRDRLSACKQKSDSWNPPAMDHWNAYPGQQLLPKQEFPSRFLTVHSPDAEGWIVTDAGRNGIAFGKRGSESGETYGAQVISLEMPPTANADDFVALVKKRIATMNPPPRFQQSRADFKYTDERGYPCVDARSIYDDNAAQTPEGTRQLKLKVIALYCRHPVRPDVGFFAAYSYRGKTADVQIEDAAKSFIEAITVPK